MTIIKQISKNVFQVTKTVNVTKSQWDRYLSAEDSRRIKLMKISSETLEALKLKKLTEKLQSNDEHQHGN